MTKSQVILAALTALIALEACSKTFPEARSPESLAIARTAVPAARTARRTPPVIERCAAPVPQPVAPTCGQ